MKKCNISRCKLKIKLVLYLDRYEMIVFHLIPLILSVTLYTIRYIYMWTVGLSIETFLFKKPIYVKRNSPYFHEDKKYL